MKAIRSTIVATAVLGMLAGAALQANAESQTKVTAEAIAERTEVTVNFADLNLNSPEGQEALYFRISNAAQEACGPSDLRQAGSLAQATRNRDCYRESLSRALSEVNQSAVAATN